MANFIAGWTMFFLILFGFFMVAAPIVGGPICNDQFECRGFPAAQLEVLE